MWPNIRFLNFNNSQQNVLQQTQQTNETNIKRMSALDSNQLLDANSIRSLFGDNLSNNLLDSISPFEKKLETDIKHRNVGQESDHFSRIVANRLTNMSNIDHKESEYRTNQMSTESSTYRSENRFFDPTKMPQKSILKKSKDQLSENPSVLPNIPKNSFYNIEDEDIFLYGSGSSLPKSLPPGIVELKQRNAPNVERVLSPISLRLNREMENIDWGRRPSPPKQLADWPQTLPNRHLRSNDEHLPQTNSWIDEENYQRRGTQLSNRLSSPQKGFDDLLNNEFERVRYLPIDDNFPSHTQTRQRNSSPLISPLRYRSNCSRKAISPRSSPEMSLKRSRRRSPSLSPQRRSISPRYKRLRSRSRSSSRSQNRYRRSRSRSSSRSRSDSRNRSRRRSPTPDRRKSPINTRDSERLLINPLAPHPISPMRPMIPISPQGMGFMPDFGPRPPFVGPQMYFTCPNTISYVPQNVMSQQTITTKAQVRDKSALKSIPLTSTQSSTLKKESEKEENKLTNPRDLLIAERSKLREELEGLRKQLERKNDEQKAVQLKDGGKDSYAFKQLEKFIINIKRSIDEQHNKLEKNAKAIHDIEKSKSKEKESIRKAKLKITTNLYDSKKKETNVSSQVKQDSIEVKKTTNIPKTIKKDIIDEEEEDERMSRFHYFDSGPHWCKSCDLFFPNMKHYFEHIHTKDHLNKQKESERTPWKTKESIKENENKLIRNKEQLIVASKGIQFIHPTQGFYCELCKQAFVDMNQVETHFKSAKHNRSYTRYTLLHNDYEPKWKSDRDKSFTEFKKREREAERDRSKKEQEDRVSKRKKLEEEMKTKDKEVKEKIEAMNKTSKVVTELDELKVLKIGDRKDENKSPKGSGIRLNLSNNKNESHSKSRDKSKIERFENKNDKRYKYRLIDKTGNQNEKKDHSKEKCKEDIESLSKTQFIGGFKTEESHEKSHEKRDQMNCDENDGLLKTRKSYETPIEGMECIIIDEINCENNDELESNKSFTIENLNEKAEQNFHENNMEVVLVSIEKKQESNDITSTQKQYNLNQNKKNCGNDSETNEEHEKKLDLKSIEKDLKSPQIIANVSIDIEKTTNQCKDNINAQLIGVENLGTNEDNLDSCQIKDKSEANESSNIERSAHQNENHSKNISNIVLQTNQNDVQIETKYDSNENLGQKAVANIQIEDHSKHIQKLKSNDEKEKLKHSKENTSEKTEKDSLKNKQKSSQVIKKDDLLTKNENEVKTIESPIDMNEKNTKSFDENKRKSDSPEKHLSKTKDSNENKNHEISGESLKNRVKTERISIETKEVDEEFEDELEGFDVIDSINDESIEDNDIELIDLSDDN